MERKGLGIPTLGREFSPWSLPREKELGVFPQGYSEGKI